jgi:hypothetical protein
LTESAAGARAGSTAAAIARHKAQPIELGLRAALVIFIRFGSW